MAAEEDIKQAAIDLAQKQAADGAHYLWATAGNRPGKADGASYRPSKAQLHANVPDLGDDSKPNGRKEAPFVPMLFSAFTDANLVCLGRCGLPEVQKLSLAMDIPVKDALKLKLKGLTAAQVSEFKKKTAEASKYRWPRPNSNLDRSADPSTIWGESCVGVRHFDCIGLVNFCYSEAAKMNFNYSIDHFAVPTMAKSVGFVEVKPISAAKPGDIVTVGREHIGIVSDSKTVIEAMDTLNGVVERPMTAGVWTQCWYIPPSALK
ncbi:MAG TPA: NlpC/P60 family protein [Bryobacteraceae bacterium]|nr:NlpC/P60 family protein [Bryobacteraceae bacterium]